MRTDDLIKENIIKGDILVIQPNVSKYVSGKVILENKNGNVKMIKQPRIPHQKKYTGQITGIFRVL